MFNAALAGVFAVLFLGFVCIPGCTAPEWTKETAEKAGFTEVSVGGYAWFGCSGDDMFQTRFAGKNAQGVPVTGVVCCGFLKSCTVRF